MRQKTLLHSLLIPVLLISSIAFNPSFAGTTIDAPHTTASGTIHFVQPQGEGSCSSWEDACQLQSALLQAEQGDEIWVAGGIHYPGAPGAERTVSFELKSGVALYGGFNGTEWERSQRNWTANPSILSGDLSRDGWENGFAYHVVTAFDIDLAATLDGFTVTAGNANGDSSFHEWGGGMYAYNSRVILRHVQFRHNWANGGGGLFVDNCPSNYPLLINVEFYDNFAYINGGGLHTFSGSSPQLINVTFSYNSAIENGGAIYNAWDMSAGGNRVELTNSILWRNESYNNPSSSQIYNASTSTVNYSIIQGGYTGAGENNLDTDPLFVDAFSGNLRLQDASPAIGSGSNAALPPGVTTDLDGSPRRVGVKIDMGAYEAQAAAPILYVDSKSPGPLRDGGSWAKAFTSLQTALAAAMPGNQIWVASGNYYPGPAGSRKATFLLKDGVEIFGGFAGNETSLSQRIWQTYPSFLNGDLARDLENKDGNAYNVVTSLNDSASTVLDGFIITHGNSYSDWDVAGVEIADRTLDEDRWVPGGGGMAILQGSPTLRNILFQDNRSDIGGGMLIREGNPILEGIRFVNNEAELGGGLAIFFGNPILEDVNFFGNRATREGGGIFNRLGSPTLTNIFFAHNSAEKGGGISIDGREAFVLSVFMDLASSNEGSSVTDSSLTLTNAIFLGNMAGTSGGGMHILNDSPSLTNLTLYGNTAGANGGGIYTYQDFFFIRSSFLDQEIVLVGEEIAPPKLTNSILWNNYPNQIGGEPWDVTYSNIKGGYSGLHNLNRDPLFANPEIADLRLQPGSPSIDSGNNQAVPPTIVTDLGGKPRFVDFTYTGSATVDMGAYEAQLSILYMPLTSRHFIQ
jgi:hypothetical protein